jgi:phenylalanyl-tRNA synthetase alpha chain
MSPAGGPPGGASDEGPEISAASVAAILADFASEAETVSTVEELEELRARYVGRKRGRLTAVFQGLRELAGDERKVVGREANLARQAVERRLSEIDERLRSAIADGGGRGIDVTLPGAPDPLGGLHPIARTMTEIEQVFTALGYHVIDGPEVETDWYNFEALNIPPDHPARDEQDTLYLHDDLLLRTHTSPVQIRYMQSVAPPLAGLFPGRVYRRDTPDPTHCPMFVQCEGLVIDHDITMADLKGTLDHFAKELFGPATETRFRPGYFPFTEPSAELDATCPACAGTGCRVCKGSGWVEMLGSGMVHPAVLENVGYDPDEVQGFAFGMGIDRIAAVRHGIEDIRVYYENDLRFLRQFAV